MVWPVGARYSVGVVDQALPGTILDSHDRRGPADSGISKIIVLRHLPVPGNVHDGLPTRTVVNGEKVEAPWGGRINFESTPT